MLTNEYLKRVYEGLEKRNANEPEFLQAVREVLESIQPVVEKHPEYEKAGRQDLADKENAELVILETYLPKPLTDEELAGVIEKTIAETGASSPKEMGKVMNAIMQGYKGRVDGKKLSQAVRTRLSR